MDRDYEQDLIVPRSGDKKQTCPACGPTRNHPRDQSMSVNADGRFYCHNCFTAGKVGANPDPNRYGTMPKVYAPPKVYAKPHPPTSTALTREGAKFFTDRAISLDTVRAIGITDDGRGIRFPYYRNGDLVNIKSRRIADKDFRMETGAELVFYNLDGCANAQQVVICEGECDVLALHTAGIKAVLSVPNGAQTGSMDFMASGEHIFTNCHTIILAVDNDEPGQKLEAELARRLGTDVCYRVRWPEGCKDANDVLMQHGADTLRTCIADARPYPKEGLIQIEDIDDEINDLFLTGYDHGIGVGSPRMDHHYRVRPGEFTIVTGIPSHGKSTWLDWMLVRLAELHGWSFAVASPEYLPIARHVGAILTTHVGKPFDRLLPGHMSLAEMNAAKEWAKPYFSFIHTEEPSLDMILDRARTAVFRNGIKGLVIDPWNALESARPSHISETDYISTCLGKMRSWAGEHKVHVWLVAHPTKVVRTVDGTEPVVSLGDVSGSASFRTKADTGITVWRNINDTSEPVQVHVTKVRFGEIGNLGMTRFHFNASSNRYVELSA